MVVIIKLSIIYIIFLKNIFIIFKFQKHNLKILKYQKIEYFNMFLIHKKKKVDYLSKYLTRSNRKVFGLGWFGLGVKKAKNPARLFLIDLDIFFP